MTFLHALIIVDAQIDFAQPSGALYAPNGDQTVKSIKQLLQQASQCFDFLILSRDWHPLNHSSFATWPPHCVQQSSGASFHPSLADLPTDKPVLVISKGTSPHDPFDSNSAFGNKYQTPPGPEDTRLADILHKMGTKKLYVVGFVLEVCIKATILSALDQGFECILIPDCCAALDPNQLDSTMQEIRQYADAVGTPFSVLNAALLSNEISPKTPTSNPEPNAPTTR